MMTKTIRTFALAVATLATLGPAGAALACPPCSMPWMWGGSCLRQYCQICGCDEPLTTLSAGPRETPASAATTCAAAADALAPPSAPVAAPAPAAEAGH